MKCFSICSACAKMCINEGHSKTAVLCGECADICSLAIKFHSSDSEFNRPVLDLCSKICTRCAEECSHHKITHCQECAEICRECSKACQNAR